MMMNAAIIGIGICDVAQLGLDPVTDGAELALLAARATTATAAAEQAGREAGVVSDTTARLASHVQNAVADYDSGAIGMTARQARAAARNPNLEPAFRGQVIDNAVKNAARNDPDLPNLWVSRSGEFGPDFHDIGTQTWWDITTRAQFQNHLDLYDDPFGTGIGLFTH
jgi:hypothetical protein